MTSVHLLSKDLEAFLVFRVIVCRFIRFVGPLKLLFTFTVLLSWHDVALSSHYMHQHNFFQVKCVDFSLAAMHSLM